jgi:hypothetical protein
MGTITISVDDTVEAQFRKVAKRILGERKGYLGEATTEAMRLFIREKTQEAIRTDALLLMENEYHFGRRSARECTDLHDPTIGPD